MHRKTIILISILALSLISIVPVLAAKPENKPNKAATNGLSKGKNDHLYLYEKDPETWEIEEEPAWAKMNINTNNDKFVFNAHKLEPETEYALICYKEDWPGTGSLILGNATSDENGNVHIKGTINYDDLPVSQYDTDGDQEMDTEGTKIWLVLASDIQRAEVMEETEMTAWQPMEYLFEFDLINKQIIGE